MGKHAGFTEDLIDDVAKAYRQIYQSQTSVFNALKRIEADINDTPVRAEIINFIRAVNLKIAGDKFANE